MSIKIEKTVQELWNIAQEINKKDMTKEDICKKHGMSSRKFTDLIKNTPIRYKNLKEGYVWEENPVSNIEQKTDDPVEEKKVGRPQMYIKDDKGKNVDLKKLTLEIDKTVYNALQFKKIAEGLTINKYIENLLRENVEPIYFNTVKNLNK